jgi:putative hydrolase of the HAD superfamily
MKYKAVLFDLGGVVFDSPVFAIRQYEQQHGYPTNYINIKLSKSKAWSDLEKGLINKTQFFSSFDGNTEHNAPKFNIKDIWSIIEKSVVPRSEMLIFIKTLRQLGLKTAAVTNNFPTENNASCTENKNSQSFSSLQWLIADGYMDAVVESCVEQVRKPDPKIYQIACDRLGVHPSSCIFLGK